MIRLPNGHRTAIVGAGGTLGSACVRSFAEAGAIVCALDLREEAAAAAVKGLGERHCYRKIDVTNPSELKALALELEPTDSVVYAVGIVFDDDVVDMNWTAYRRLMEINLDGAFYTGAAFARPMIGRRRQGSLVFISSMSGLRGEPSASAYCASKFGMIGMVQSFAAELTRHEIRANAVCPGNVDGPLLRSAADEMARRQGKSTAEVYAGLAYVGAAQRFVEPAEVAQLCLFLASPAASGITGAALPVDCGALIDWPVRGVL